MVVIVLREVLIILIGIVISGFCSINGIVFFFMVINFRKIEVVFVICKFLLKIWCLIIYLFNIVVSLSLIGGIMIVKIWVVSGKILFVVSLIVIVLVVLLIGLFKLNVVK